MSNMAMMFPIHKIYTTQIFELVKKIEFRTKLPKHLKVGMKIYFYEALGKRHTKKEVGYIVKSWTDGAGAVVGEATVKEIKEIKLIDGTWYYVQDNKIVGIVMLETIKKFGYTNQRFAIELDNIIKYDEEWQSEQLSNLDYDFTEESHMIELILNAPRKPIAKEEFVGWNKTKDYYDKEYNDYMSFEQFLETGKKIDFKTNGSYGFNLHLTNAPQAPIYVVEREVK